MGGRVQLAGRRGGQLYLVPICTHMYREVDPGRMAFVIVPAAAVGGRRRRAPRGTAFVYSSKAALLACRRNLQHNHIPQAQAGRIRSTDAPSGDSAGVDRTFGIMQSGNLKIQLGVAPGGGRGAGHSRVTVHRERPSPPSVGRHRRVCRVMCAARRPSCGARNYPRFCI